ncbi:MAG: esterase family protein [Bacteroidales bacterium]|nr:esterase family protein [Bacteroidales bacterium]MBP5518212.1 esterase family protein [Bacteroidales bacterium]
MKKYILSIIVLLAFSVFANASKVVTDSIYSNNLKCWQKYNVYLPTGFEKSEKQYPVVYLLHGLYGSYFNWEKSGNMKLVADELISSGEADEMVIIMPNAGDYDVRNYQNGYFNVVDWPYEDFFFNELLPAAEKKYRVIGDKEHRAIMGLSMGGGGSVVYSQRHPDMFSSCYAMSAWLDNKMGEVAGNNQKKDKLYIVCESVSEHSAINFVENADDATIAKLKTVKWFIDCGDDDFLMDLSILLYQKMRDKKIKAELRIRNGVHNWEYWHTALRMALPFASRNFAK